MLDFLYRDGEGNLGREGLIALEKETERHWKAASFWFKFGYLKVRWYYKLRNIKYKCLKYFS